MAGYEVFGIRTIESTACTVHRGSATQLEDTCLVNHDELQRCRADVKCALRLDRLGNDARGALAHRVIECKGSDRYVVTIFHDENEFDRRFYLAGAASKARADRAFQTFLQRVTA
jgi:hypothetical protein